MLNFSPGKDLMLKKILLIFLVFLVILACMGIVFRYRTLQRMDKLNTLIGHDNPEKKTITGTLLYVNESENHFQVAVAGHDQKSFFEYKRKLHLALETIDSIVHAKTDLSGIKNQEARDSLVRLFQVKEMLSDSFFVLRNNAVSFSARAEANVTGKTALQVIESARMARQRFLPPDVDIDTSIATISAGPKQKKGLFKRIGAAISNKEDTSAGSHEKIVINSMRKDTVIQYMQSMLAKSDSAQGAMLGSVKRQVSGLSDITARLLITNGEITEKLRLLVSRLESISDRVSQQMKQIANDEYNSLNAFIRVQNVLALAFVILLSVLLIRYVNKMYTATTELEKEHRVVSRLLAEKRELLAVVSHEIRNPLNSVIGFVSALKSTTLTERQSEMVGSAEISGKMLLATVNDLLDMSKLESGTFQINNQPFNPFLTIQQVVSITKMDADAKNLKTEISFSGDKQMQVTGDSSRLSQVLTNLISNAIKFTDRGTVSVHASLSVYENKPELSVSVTDTGMGMTTEQQAKLFTKYYRTDAVKGISGAGLGLYICYKLITLQKGNISVASRPGKGTRFSFTIPFLPAGYESRKDGNEQGTGDPYRFTGKRLVVVDDNLLNLKLIETMTKSWSMQVVLMNNGRAALEYISRNGADIVISDLHMPEMDGLELVKALKADPLTRQIPVLLSSGESLTEERMNEYKKSGFAGSIAKPFTQVQLLSTMERVLYAR